jgi:hypothetical protein
MLTLDLLHKVLLDDPDYDTESDAEPAIKSALLSLVDALALYDGNPNREEYIASLVDLHGDDDDPLTAACATAAAWLRDTRAGGPPEVQP